MCTKRITENKTGKNIYTQYQQKKVYPKNMQQSRERNKNIETDATARLFGENYLTFEKVKVTLV